MTKWFNRPTPIQKNLLDAIAQGGVVETKPTKDKRRTSTKIKMPDGTSMSAKLSQIEKLRKLGFIP